MVVVGWEHCTRRTAGLRESLESGCHHKSPNSLIYQIYVIKRNFIGSDLSIVINMQLQKL
jgi:hypothetical protein